MSKFLVLTKVLLKNGSDSLTFGGNKKKLTKTAAMWLLLIVAFAPTVFMFTRLISSLYDSLVMIGQEGMVLALGIAGVSFMVFFFGIFYAISTFYFSKDIENLLPLPLRPSQILGAKFTVSLIYEYLTELLFLLPILIMYGIKSSSGIIYYLYGIIIFFTLPAVPLAIATLIDMVVFRFTNIGKNKDKFRIIGGMIALLLGLGISMVSSRIGNVSMDQKKMVELATSGNNSLVKITSRIFPGSIFASNAMVRSNSLVGLLNLLVFIGCFILVILLFITISEKLYFKGVIGVSEVSSKKKKMNDEEFAKVTQRNSSLKSLTMKEIKILIRTPVYFINCVIMNFLWPLFLIISVILQPKSSGGMSQLSAMLSGKSPYVLMGIFGLSLFIAPTNAITSTSISREGENIYVCKYIPVSFKTQLMAKVLSGLIFSLIGSLLIVIIGDIFIKMPVYVLLMVLILVFLGVSFSCLAGMLIDLNFPKLHWDNEQKAVKQNFNSLLCMLICFILAGVSIFAAAIFHLNTLLTFAMLGGITLVFDIILYNVLCTSGVETFKKIQG